MTALSRTDTIDHSVNPDRKKACALLRAASHPQRLSILELLSEHERLCNQELQDRLGMDQPILSQHLTKMRESGLVDFVKEGRHRYYFIKIQGFGAVMQSLENCFSRS